MGTNSPPVVVPSAFPTSFLLQDVVCRPSCLSFAFPHSPTQPLGFALARGDHVPWADCSYQTGWLPQKHCQHHFSSRYICFPKKTYWWPVSYLPFPPLQSLLSSLLLPESCVVAMVTPLSLKIHFFPQCRLKFLSFTLRRELPPSKVALIEHEMLCS